MKWIEVSDKAYGDPLFIVLKGHPRTRLKIASYRKTVKYRLARNAESLEVEQSAPEQPPGQAPEPAVAAPTPRHPDASAVKPSQLGFDF
jgi:hypothetical protein